MKKKKVDEKELVLEKKKKLALFMSEIVLQKEKNVKKGRLLRREIARMLTLLRERDIIDKEKI